MLLSFSISIHAPRGGSDTNELLYASFVFDFNPRSPWGERLGVTLFAYSPTIISIHAPRGGSDEYEKQGQTDQQISIHAPRGGSDKFFHLRAFQNQIFQSTLPVGGATGCIAYCQRSILISIHAPRGGSDLIRPIEGDL